MPRLLSALHALSALVCNPIRWRLQPTRGSRELGSSSLMSSRHRNLESLGRWHATIARNFKLKKIFDNFHANFLSKKYYSISHLETIKLSFAIALPNTKYLYHSFHYSIHLSVKPSHIRAPKPPPPPSADIHQHPKCPNPS